MTWEEESLPWMRDRVSLVLSKTLELLSDGEWHDYEQLLREVIKVVPPGVALRYAQTKRFHMAKQNAKKRLTPEEFKEWLATHKPSTHEATQERSKDENTQIRVGARAKVVDSLNKSTRVEKRRVDEVVQIRRIPVSEKTAVRMGLRGGEAAHGPE